jgi:predicted kinase
MLVVTICKGLPASGKSTWAKAQVLEHPNTIKRINKDDLRAMLDCSHYDQGNERFVEAARDYLILAALRDGKHVIVDDTNLNPRHDARIRQVVAESGIPATVEVKVFEIDVEEAIRRDSLRATKAGEKSIGEHAIRRMWADHLA